MDAKSPKAMKYQLLGALYNHFLALLSHNTFALNSPIFFSLQALF